jgi:hypothetical protein
MTKQRAETAPPASKYWPRTVDLKPTIGVMLKPGEMIDIRGTEGLTLQDRKIYNLLIHHAFGPQMAEFDHQWTIPLSVLRGAHKGNERISASIHRLMTTVVTARLLNGKTRRFQLLGGNDMDDEDRPGGRLTYNFDRRLVEVLRDSVSFGRLELAVMKAFTSKYALGLYEHVAKRVRFAHKMLETYTLDEFRAILGVPSDKLKAFSNLNQKAIVPALLEINALCDFTVLVTPRKTSRQVTHIVLGWESKDHEGRAEAFRELRRPRVGRRARLEGQVERLD